MFILGVSGKVGVGKDTFVDRMIEELRPDHTTSKVAFGDAVKEEAAALFGFERGLAYSREGKEAMVSCPGWHSGLRVRELLQLWGHGRRMADPEYWIRQTHARVKASGASGASVVFIPDVRYRGEAEAVRAWGGVLLRIDPFPGWVPGTGAGHASETDLDDYEGFDARMPPLFGLPAVERAAGFAAETLRSCLDFGARATYLFEQYCGRPFI